MLQCVQFHPNSNYVATGSSDRSVRLWDCVTGNHVRLMTGHKVSWQWKLFLNVDICLYCKNRRSTFFTWKHECRCVSVSFYGWPLIVINVSHYVCVNMFSQSMPEVFFKHKIIFANIKPSCLTCLLYTSRCV